MSWFNLDLFSPSQLALLFLVLSVLSPSSFFLDQLWISFQLPGALGNECIWSNFHGLKGGTCWGGIRQHANRRRLWHTCSLVYLCQRINRNSQGHICNMSFDSGFPSSRIHSELSAWIRGFLLFDTLTTAISQGRQSRLVWQRFKYCLWFLFKHLGQFECKIWDTTFCHEMISFLRM